MAKQQNSGMILRIQAICFGIGRDREVATFPAVAFSIFEPSKE
jgi:hypothetical protein